MSEIDKRRFRTIETDPEELEAKIKAHKRKVRRTIILIVVITVITLIGVYFFTQNRTYKSYQVVQEVERMDTVGTNYVAFQGNVLKYSVDGAIYCTSMNKLIWNQPYEMNDPIVDTCEDYVAIADRGGTKIYIGNSSLPKGEIEVSNPIRQIEVGNQGTVAVLMSNGNQSEIKLYSIEGKLLAQGVFHLEISGYPMSISLSNKGTLLGVSFLKLDEGQQNTVIQFFDFGKGGEEEIDHVVQEYTYTDAVFPQIQFLDQNTMIAYGDHATRLYGTGNSFSIIKELTYTEEVQGVFYNEEAWGLVKNNQFVVYGLDGKERYKNSLTGTFTRILMLENQGLAIINGSSCDLYSKTGVKKFEGEMDQAIELVEKGIKDQSYTMLLEGKTVQINLR